MRVRCTACVAEQRRARRCGVPSSLLRDFGAAELVLGGAAAVHLMVARARSLRR